MPSHGMLTPPATPMMELLQEKQQQQLLPSSPNLSYQSKKRPIPKPSLSTRSISIKENVQVMVRCRPRSDREIEHEKESCWNVRAQVGAIQLLKPKSPSSKRNTFYFDNVLEGVGNAQVYDASIRDLVRSAMMGYNGTVFAYGQTASGKTYTMILLGTEEEPGVIPRSIQDVFAYIEEDTYGREYLLRVSYMEIYNEQIKDLLNVENTNPEIVEDKKGVYVRNLKEVVVKTSEEVIECIKAGERNRHISATDYNQRSSRSHTIFQLIIESHSKGTNRGFRLSQLNLIDLAGSEKVASDNERRKEGAYINKSLLTLGNVISKLTSDIPSTHIPFRDSKLTRILQAALSGNARISVICTINPTLASRNESLNTLRFAQHAKLIKTAAKMTKIHDHSELQNYLIKIEELQSEMQEKNELEAETRERLNNLLSLILTSSKNHDDEEEIMLSSWSDDTTTASSADDLANSITMRDVVARCEQGFAAQIASHQREMAAMKQHAESMQDMVRVLESVQAKQAETLSRREAQIAKLEQDLAVATTENLVVVAAPPKPTTSTNTNKPVSRPSMYRASRTPTVNHNKKTTALINLQDFSSAITLAAQRIAGAVSSGVSPSFSFDKNGFAKSAASVIEKSIASVFEQDIVDDPSGMTVAVTELCCSNSVSSSFVVVEDEKPQPIVVVEEKVEVVKEEEKADEIVPQIQEEEKAVVAEEPYVPYSQSINQPWFPFHYSVIINRYLFFFIVLYIIS